MDLVLTAGLAGTVIAAATLDLHARRIPNGLTVGALVFALLVRAVPGEGSLVDGLLGFGLAAVILIPLFAGRVIGGGDAKLLMAVGAFFGPRDFVVALLATALAGGALALFMTIRNGTIVPTLLGVADTMRYGATIGRSGSRPAIAADSPTSLPYAVAVATGSFATLYLATLA